MRFIDDWRAGKASIKDALKGRTHEEQEKAPETEQEIERRFLRKVEHELSLPEYSLFS